MAGGFIPTDEETRYYQHMMKMFAGITAQPAIVWQELADWERLANSLSERLGVFFASRLADGCGGFPGIGCARFVNRDSLMLGSGGREPHEPLATAHSHTLRSLRGFSSRAKASTPKA